MGQIASSLQLLPCSFPGWHKHPLKAYKYSVEPDECLNQQQAGKVQSSAPCFYGASTSSKAAKTNSGKMCSSCSIADKCSPATAGWPAASAAKPQKLDPKDFMFMGLQSAQQWKLPGSINGQQFSIDSCQGCDLFVLDTCAMVTIDDCTDCRIFIGPTESSVFIRNCKNCSFACITRQLRTRDCRDCQLLLLCRTRPIIESSSGMAFDCLDTPYSGLAAQLAAAKLNPLHNFWSDVFDFTPAADNGSNWSLLPAEGASLQQLLGPLPEPVQRLMLPARPLPVSAPATEAAQEKQQTDIAAAGSATAAAAAACSAGDEQCRQQKHDDSADSLAVVCTRGTTRQQPSGACFSFLLIPSTHHAATLQWVSQHLRSRHTRLAQNVLVHTNEAAVARQVVQQMAAAAGWPASDWQQLLSPQTASAAAAAEQKCRDPGASKLGPGCCIGLEVMSTDEAAREQLWAAAVAQLGALCTSSDKVAKLFRNLGTDG